MGNKPDGSIPQPVQEAAKKAGQDLLDHPEKLGAPGGVVKDLKKIPGQIADGLTNPPGQPGQGAPGKAPGDAAGGPPKREPNPHVTGGPDLDPHAKIDDHGKPDLRGTTGGGHVGVEGKDGGVSYAATVRGAGGLDAQGKVTGKGGVDAGVTFKGGGGPGGPPPFSITGKGEGSGVLGPRDSGHLGASVEGKVEITKGVDLTAKVFGSVDAAQGAHGSTVTPNVGAQGGLSFNLDGGGKSAPASSHHGLSPGEALAAKITHDRLLSKEAPTEAERKLATERLAAEEKVQADHPEYTTRNMELKSHGTRPGDFTVQKMGETLSGKDVEMPAALKQEVQDAMQRQARTDAHDQVQSQQLARGQERPAQGQAR